MVEAKGYWLSVRTELLEDTQKNSDNNKDTSRFILKIHDSNSPIMGVADGFHDALENFKKNYLVHKAEQPSKIPHYENFEDHIKQKANDLAMVFISAEELR